MESTDTTYYGYDRQIMQAVSRPRNVALIGATEREGAIGQVLTRNLLRSKYEGGVFFVNPNRKNIGKHTCYKRITDIKAPIDLVLVATPVHTVRQVIRECIKAGVKGAVMFSEGFAEQGIEQASHRLQLLQEARKGNLRVLGPNSVGFMNPRRGLNASLRSELPMEGNIGFLCQSGGLGMGMLDMSATEKIGFSAFISVGMMDDLEWSDMIHFLGDNPFTKVLILHLESVQDPRRFISAAREVGYQKPIIALRGKKRGGNQTPAFQAMFRRSGVLEVENVAQLFSIAGALSKQPHSRGKRLAIVTNSGGLATLAADALREGGGKLATFSDETRQTLREQLPAGWNRNGIVDLQNRATPENYALSVETLAEDQGNDGVLVIYTPQAIVNATQVAGKLKAFAKLKNKPFLTCFLGGNGLSAATNILNEAQIPTLPYPDTAAKIFNYLWKYAANLKTIYQTPRMTDKSVGLAEKEEAAAYINLLTHKGKTNLTRLEIEKIFETYHLPKFREVLIPAGPDDLHFELQLGSYIDSQFGPLVFAGRGGALGVRQEDYAVGLPPLNTNLALRMLEQTDIFRTMVKTNLPSAVIDELEEVLVKISRLVAEQRRIKDLRIPSLWVTPDGIFFNQAKLELYEQEVEEEDLIPLAIRPYPIEYERIWKLRNGQIAQVRPIRPEDEPLLVKFHESLSNQTVYFRYFHSMSFDQRVSHERLARLCFIDYDQEMALVVERPTEGEQNRGIVGAGRLRKLSGTRDAEFAVMVSDDYQRTGLGTQLLRMLLEVGRNEKLAHLRADILPENVGMRKVSEKLGFKVRFDGDEGVLKAIYTYE
ncbi:MAG: GNAT family N-acetyltransferase [Bacteroidota bacterium]